MRRLLCLLLTAFFPCVAASARAQDGATAPEKGGKKTLPEKIQGTTRRISSSLQRVGVYPYVTSLATGGGAAPGLAYFDPGMGPGFYGGLSHSLKGDTLFEVRLGKMPHEPNRAPTRRLGFEWMPHFVTERSPEDRFFVYGQARLLDLGAGRYLQGYSDPLRQQSLDVVSGYRLAPGLAVQVQTGTLTVTPGPDALVQGQVFGKSSLDTPGLAWERKFLRVTSELALDTRIQPRHTQGGSFVSLKLDLYHGVSETPGFTRVALDARHYLPLESTGRHLLALRAAGSYAQHGGVPVPYYLQYSLGGGSILRSYPEHRFSGDSIYAVSAEYRFQANDWLQLAAFFDGGAASGGFDSLNSNGFRTSTGLGARLTTSDSVILRFDVARGADGTRFNARIGYSF